MESKININTFTGVIELIITKDGQTVKITESEFISLRNIYVTAQQRKDRKDMPIVLYGNKCVMWDGEKFNELA